MCTKQAIKQQAKSQILTNWTSVQTVTVYRIPADPMRTVVIVTGAIQSRTMPQFHSHQYYYRYEQTQNRVNLILTAKALVEYRLSRFDQKSYLLTVLRNV